MSAERPEPTITLTVTKLSALLAAARGERPANDVPVAPAPITPRRAELPEYLTTKEAAALLGVSPKGLEAMRARGDGPPFTRIGRRVRYVATELPGAASVNARS
jgi:hypothetical protein